MDEVLQAKRQEILLTLIERLSVKNSDLEYCLNANLILQELTDSEIGFLKLVEPALVSQLIANACDLRNPNQAYAINVLINIIKEYPDHEHQLSKTEV